MIPSLSTRNEILRNTDHGHPCTPPSSGSAARQTRFSRRERRIPPCTTSLPSLPSLPSPGQHSPTYQSRLPEADTVPLSSDSSAQPACSGVCLSFSSHLLRPSLSSRPDCPFSPAATQDPPPIDFAVQCRPEHCGHWLSHRSCRTCSSPTIAGCRWPSFSESQLRPLRLIICSSPFDAQPRAVSYRQLICGDHNFPQTC